MPRSMPMAPSYTSSAILIASVFKGVSNRNLEVSQDSENRRKEYFHFDNFYPLSRLASFLSLTTSGLDHRNHTTSRVKIRCVPGNPNN